MSTTHKTTKREMFDLIKSLCGDRKEVVEFCDHEIGLLTKKASTKKLTAAQKANEGIKEHLYALLVKRPMTVSEILKVEGFEDYTNQKICALLRQLVLAGRVTRFEDNRKTYFKV